MRLRIITICIFAILILSGCSKVTENVDVANDDEMAAEKDVESIEKDNITLEFEADEDIIVDDSVEETDGLEVDEQTADMPDVVDGVETEVGFSEEEIKNAFQATYRSDDVGELTITEKGDDIYNVNFGLYGIGLFEDTQAYYDNYAIHFTFYSPNQEPVRGYIEFTDTLDVARVVIIESQMSTIDSGTMIEIEKRIEF